MDTAICREDMERYAREMIAYARKAGYSVDDVPHIPEPAAAAGQDVQEDTPEKIAGEEACAPILPEDASDREMTDDL